MLIETNDLDPMYAVIRQLRNHYDDEWYFQWLMYYSLFYDARGAMAALDWEPEEFWDEITKRALDPHVKRGPERRHFRGINALRSIQTLSNDAPQTIFKDMYRDDYEDMLEHIHDHYAGSGFGPYFTWKLMDFFNVCSDMPVALKPSVAMKCMPGQPKEAALNLFGGWENAQKVNDYISEFKHPVRPGNCGWAETETVLCNYKGLFDTGTVWIGRDIAEYSLVLKGTGYEQYLPPMVPRAKYHCVLDEKTFEV